MPHVLLGLNLVTEDSSLTSLHRSHYEGILEIQPDGRDPLLLDVDKVVQDYFEEVEIDLFPHEVRDLRIVQGETFKGEQFIVVTGATDINTPLGYMEFDLLFVAVGKIAWITSIRSANFLLIHRERVLYSSEEEYIGIRHYEEIGHLVDLVGWGKLVTRLKELIDAKKD